MSSFDLVPQDYRLQLAQHKMLQQFGGLLALLCVVLLGSYVLLAWLHSQHQASLATLQAEQLVKQDQINTYQALRHQQSSLKSQVEQLAQFHGTGATHRLLQSVEAAAAGGNVWLTHWRYTRQPATQPHQVELHGDAVDHGALSDFVQQLLRSPHIVDAGITRSTMKSDDGTPNAQQSGRKVAFRLKLDVRNDPTIEENNDASNDANNSPGVAS